MTSDPAPSRAGAARRAVLDANVLVPNALRDTLLRAAEAGLYEPYWSATTLEEVERALRTRILHAQPARDERVGRLLRALREAFPAATVPEDAALLARLTNDPKDRHVLAVAVQRGARLIVTANLRDFPADALALYRIAARSPDQFLRGLLRRHPARLLDVLAEQGAALRQPRTLDAILATLAQHAPAFADAARAIAREAGR